VSGGELVEVRSEEGYGSWGNAELALFGTHGCTSDTDDVTAVKKVVCRYEGFGICGIAGSI
jgi:hypothetical protein